MITARSVAVKVICDILSDKSYSNIAVDSALANANLSKKDSGLATTLIYGVLQRKITLERILEELNSKKGKTDDYVSSALFVGLYQILFLDRIPESAAVNETVNVIKQSKFKFAAGFVNAILRKAAAGKTKILQSIADSRDISFKYSCPVPLLKGLIVDYGRETTEGFLGVSLESPKMYARINTLKTTKDELFERLSKKGIECREAIVDGCFCIENGGGLKELQEFKEGLFYIQDPASQLAVAALKIEPSMSVLDICSAPGGKSFTAAMHLKGKGRIVSCDIYEKRVGLIADGASRLGVDCISTAVADATVKVADLGEFDRVICDVPCSGFGVIRRKPEIKYKQEDFCELQSIQLKILKNAASYVKNGGMLLYSTCTVRKAENEQIVDEFLKLNEEFALLESRTLMPHTDGTDGFFYSVLKRK
ncbi:MAG: 16S rRNA (cytosine(967)-C(5))-methyltransferase RsmB [Ruminococcaceae bacterium]|nr:16S rRNA (cytosine(967)-C(5))-methyltransferase RsmB [Oscillospiraceae bacterium]